MTRRETQTCCDADGTASKANARRFNYAGPAQGPAISFTERVLRCSFPFLRTPSFFRGLVAATAIPDPVRCCEPRTDAADYPPSQVFASMLASHVVIHYPMVTLCGPSTIAWMHARLTFCLLLVLTCFPLTEVWFA